MPFCETKKRPGGGVHPPKTPKKFTEIPKNDGLEQELKRLQVLLLWVSMLNFGGVMYVGTKTFLGNNLMILKVA